MNVASEEHEHTHLDHDEPAVGSSVEAATVPGSWRMPADVLSVAKSQYVGYEGFNGCIGNGKILPGVRTITDYMTRHFGGIKLIYRGAYCRKISGTNSQSIHGTGRAIDIMIPPHSGWQANNTAGDRIANWLAMNAKSLGMQLIIWDRSLWRSNRGYISGYSGQSPHVDHLHVEFTKAGANGQTSWFTNGGASRSPFTPTGPPYAADFTQTPNTQANGVKFTGTVGQTKKLDFTFKNTGHKPWNPGEIKLVVSPRTPDAIPGVVRTPSWADATVLNVLSTQIKPGDTSRFSADIKLPPDHTGIRVFVGLVHDTGEKQTWLTGGPGQKAVYFDIPQPVASGKFENLTDTTPNKLVVNGTADEVHGLRYAFRNTGQDAWRAGEVKLVVAPATADGVGAIVKTPSWVSASVIQDMSATIAPGDVALFDFDFKVPAGQDGLRIFTGLRHHYAGETKWLAGGPGQTPIYFDVDQPSWAADFEQEESMEPNGVLISGYAEEKKTISFAFRNVGASTWEPERIKLVLSDPTPEDIFGVQTADWLSSQEISTLSEPVAPGNVADFEFSVQIPDSYDHTRLNVGLVYEVDGKQTWLAGGVGHAPMYFDLIRLEQSRAVVEVRGEESFAFLHESDDAPSNTIGEVSFAAGVPYEHEGISGSCQARRHRPHTLLLPFGVGFLVLVVSRRPRHLQ